MQVVFQMHKNPIIMTYNTPVRRYCVSLTVEGQAFTQVQYESEDQRPNIFIIWSSTKALPALVAAPDLKE